MSTHHEQASAEVSRERRRNACRAALRWLGSAACQSDSAALAEKDVAVRMCVWVLGDRGGITDWVVRHRVVPAHAPIALFDLSRPDLWDWTGRICAGPDIPGAVATQGWDDWRATLASLGVSYARSGDISMVAALARAASSLGLINGALVWSEAFLHDQQSLAGYFGRNEWEHQGAPSVDLIRARIRITAEIVWTLAALDAEVSSGR